MDLWNNNTEIQFFQEALKNFAPPEQLFYNLQSGYYAYVPNGIYGESQTLQSRNSLIGQFTENWAKRLIEPIANKFNLYAVNGVVCEEIGLTNRSSADLALCNSNKTIQSSENIKFIFEIKMSIVSNYIYNNSNVEYIGDYKSHKGNPSLLRSDSMLKAIGKAINIRVSGKNSSNIPIIILGNSPINKSYQNKVDFLKTSGVIQGFWSVNPSPTNSNHIRKTNKGGFNTIEKIDTIHQNITQLINKNLHYFSSMISKRKLGEIIYIANKENSDTAKADKFLNLLQDG